MVLQARNIFALTQVVDYLWSAAVTYNDPLYVSGTDPVVEHFIILMAVQMMGKNCFRSFSNNPPYNRGVYLTAENNGNGHDFIVATSASHAAGPSENFIPSTEAEPKTDGKGIQFNTQTPTMQVLIEQVSHQRDIMKQAHTPVLSSTVLNGLQIATFTDASYARRLIDM